MTLSFGPMESKSAPSMLSRWHRTPLYLRILGALLLGLVVGVLYGPGAAWLAIPGKLVLRLLGALAPALILFAIIQALIQTHFSPGTTGRLIRLLILNTLVAIGIGLLVADVIQPGKWSPDLHQSIGQPAAKAAGAPDMLMQFLDNIPRSVLGPLADDGKVIGVIFLAVGIGMALRRHAQRPLTTVKDWVDTGLEVLITMLHWIIDLVPLAVFGIVASIVGTKGFSPFQALGAFVLAVLCALVLQAAYYLIRIRFGSWVHPMDLFRGGRDAFWMAFSTSSSAITMPVTYECLRTKVKLREKSATLGALVGANFNNDGTALYEAMAALFVSQMLAAQGLGIELTLTQQLLVVVTSVIASVGAAGIPEAGLVTMTLVFNAVGLPTEYIALLLPVDWFLDRCRTTINVMGDMNVSCLLDGKTPEDSTPIPAT